MIRNQKTKLKDAFIPIFLLPKFEAAFSDVKITQSGLTQQKVYNSDLVNKGNRYRSNDLVQGNYRGIRFEKSDVIIQHTTGSGKNKSTATYFVGQWIRFEGLVKKVEGLYLLNNEMDGLFSHTLPNRKDLQTVKTESIEFNSKYKVYCVSEHDAYYVLTPPIMERFLLYSNECGVGLSIQGGVVNIALKTGKDSLEPKLFKEIDDIEVQRVNEDIRMIKSTIDLLLEAQED